MRFLQGRRKVIETHDIFGGSATKTVFFSSCLQFLVRFNILLNNCAK